jgi:hypothetical protein
MKEWIEKNLDPPGNEHKNWRSIFSFIGRVFGIVKDDAVKAHNAFFPYLADENKLEEHGRALAIPHLLYDKPDEYRNRVAAASFFLMKAGERGYIMNLLEERFGERIEVIEKFLQLQTKIADATEEEKAWVFSLLDFLVDPVVYLKITELLRYYGHINIGVLPRVVGRLDVLAREYDCIGTIGIYPRINIRVDILSSDGGI